MKTRLVPRYRSSKLKDKQGCLPVANRCFVKKLFPVRCDLCLEKELSKKVEYILGDTSRMSVFINPHGLIFLDQGSNRVCKLALDKVGEIEIENNSETLELFGEGISPIFISLNKSPLLHSEESLLKGEEISFDKALESLDSIIQTVSNIYIRTRVDLSLGDYLDLEIAFLKKRTGYLTTYKSVVEYLFWVLEKINNRHRDKQVQVCRIHGDLTFRNVIRNDNKRYLIDLARSRMSLPEFDILNYLVFERTYREPNPNYLDLFESVNDLLENDWEEVSFLKKLPFTNVEVLGLENIKVLFGVQLVMLTLSQLSRGYYPSQRLLKNIRACLKNL